MVELSTEAEVGKVLILIGIIFSIISTIVIFTIGLWSLIFPIFGILALIAGIIGIVGIFYGIVAYRICSKGNFNKAGIYGIISSLLPPLDLIMLLGAILCLISKEAKKAKR